MTKLRPLLWCLHATDSSKSVTERETSFRSLNMMQNESGNNKMLAYVLCMDYTFDAKVHIE